MNRHRQQHQRRRRGGLAFLLTAIMLLTLTPTSAFATVHTWNSSTVPAVADGDVINVESGAEGTLDIPATVNSLTINGGSNSITASISVGGGRSDPLELTLNNLTLNGDISMSCAVDVTLNLDDVTINSNSIYGAIEKTTSYGLLALNITNTVTLNGQAGGGAALGAVSSLEINGSGTLYANGGNNTGIGIVFGANSGDALTVGANCTVYAAGGDGTTNGGRGIYSNNGTISNSGSIIATGGDGEDNSGGNGGYGIGIFFSGGVTNNNGGTITATGGAGGSNATGTGGNGGYGVYVGGSGTITNNGNAADFTAEGGAGGVGTPNGIDEAPLNKAPASGTVDISAIITAQPVAQDVYFGGTAIFSMTVGVTPAPTYQWHVSTDGGSSWSNASGGIYSGDATATLTLTGVTLSMSGYQYRCVATAYGTATSNDATLTVSKAPLTLTLNNDTKTYTGNDIDIAPAQLSGVIGGATISVSYSYDKGGVITAHALDAGVYTVTASTAGDANHAGTSTTATLTVNKAPQTTPSAPTLAGKTATSITLNTIAGAEYRNGATGAWQDSPTFDALTPNAAYTFYARIKETATHEASGVSPESEEITTNKASLGGVVTISGTAVFGETLTAGTSGLTSSPTVSLGTVSYQWKREGADINGATVSTYTLTADDIGKTVTVTVTTANTQGSLTSAATAAVTKATQPAPAVPTLASKTTTSITLNTIAGAEYRNGATGAWQDSPTFDGLTPNAAYTFYARMKETTTHEASGVSPESEEITTDKASLGGVVTISGTAVFGETLTAGTSGLTSSPTVSLGTVSYQWKREGADINGATVSTYTLTADDIGKTVTVTVTTANTQGSLTSAATSAVTKATQPAPTAPTPADKTATSITLNTITGAEYRNGTTGAWQDSPTFDALTPNAAYTFYARIKETATHEASGASPESEQIITDKASLDGVVTISGTAVFGETLTAETSGLTSSPTVSLGTVSYLWKREGADINNATVSTYTLTADDIGKTVTVTVTTENTQGSLTSAATAAVAKATQPAPAVPTLASKTTTSITLNTIDGAEYRNGATGAWQASPVFDGLVPNTAYTFYVRYSEDSTHDASPASEALSVTTYGDEAELISLSVNGVELSVANEVSEYMADCDDNNLARLDMTTSPFTAVTVDGAEYTGQNIPLSGNITTINIVVASGDGKNVYRHTLKVFKAVDAGTVIIQRFDDVIAINSNPANNGGYDNIDGVRWYRNGSDRVISTEWFITISSPASNYYAEVKIDGSWHRVCGVAGQPPVRIIAYPNPVSSGESLTLQLPSGFIGGYVNIICINGSTVKRNLPLPGEFNSVDVSDLSPGIYLLNVVGKTGNKETVKIIKN